jgi:diacylglycerol kinase family enzyme
MPRTAAKVTQADIARTVRAVAQARVKAVVEVAADGTIRVLIGENAQRGQPAPQMPVEQEEEVVL